MWYVLLQGIVIGTGHDSEFGEIFKMMQGEEVRDIHETIACWSQGRFSKENLHNKQYTDTCFLILLFI